MQKIGVFLSSRSEISPSFHAAAEAVGHWIGSTGRTLIYGGSSCGLMEVLARSVRESGGRVFGVVPQILYDRKRVSTLLDVEFRTTDLHDRKAVLMRESDIFVVLPGGTGTLDEMFTVLAANAIGTDSKKVLLYNVDDCWKPLLETLDGLTQQGLIGHELQEIFRVVASIEELEAVCREA